MPAPNSRCPTLNAVYRPPYAALRFLTATGFGEPATVAVGRAPLVMPFRPANPEDRGGGHGVLLGGRSQQMEAYVFYDNAEDLEQTAQLTSVELTLGLPGEAPRRLSVAVTGDNRSTQEYSIAGVPDTDAEGDLHVRVTWADQCYQYIAEGTMTARVAGVATAAGCGVGEEAGWQQLGNLLSPPLAFGNATARFGLSAATGLLIETPIIDGPYPAIMFDRNAPAATARPGELVAFHATNPELVLGVGERATVVFYARDAVIRHIDAGGYYGGSPIPAPVLESAFELEDGRFLIQAPEVPRRYVVGISLDFTSACFSGGVVAGPGLDVVAP
jgi:hypothetical protein